MPARQQKNRAVSRDTNGRDTRRILTGHKTILKCSKAKNIENVSLVLKIKLIKIKVTLTYL